MTSNPLPAPETPPFLLPDEVRLMSAIKLFETARLSLGQAARYAGYTKSGFMDVLGHYGVAVADYPAEELAAELIW
jgi:predicted HTH domain antitoxin